MREGQRGDLLARPANAVSKAVGGWNSCGEIMIGPARSIVFRVGMREIA